METKPTTEVEGLKKDTVSLMGVTVMSICCAAPALCIGGTVGFVMGKAGLAVPLAFSVATVMVLAISASYVQLSQRYDCKGGTYAYVQRVFGGGAGLLTAWCYLAVLTSIGSVASIFAIFLNNLAPAVPRPVGCLLILALTFILGWRGAELSTKGMVVVWALQMILFIVPGVFALFTRFAGFEAPLLHAAAVAWTPETGIAGLTLGVLLCAWAFAGFETPAYMAEELKGGRATVKKAIPIGVVAIGITYVLLSWLWVGQMTNGDLAQIADSDVAIADYLSMLGDGNGVYFISAAVLISCLGGLFAWINSFPRMSLNLARGGFLPKAFLRLNKHQVPGPGVIVTAAIWLVVSFVGITISVDILLNLTSLFLGLAYVFICIANIKDSWRDFSLRGVILSKAVPVIALCMLCFLIASQPAMYLGILAAWTLAGIVLLVVLRAVKGREFFGRQGQ
jgi:amino acid transporter